MTSTDPGTGQERLTAPERLEREERLAGRPRLLQTPSQTVGPFFGFALPFEGGSELVPQGDPAAVRLHGVVRDGAGAPVPDALLELWQPDAAGRVAHQPGSRSRSGDRFTGFGRTAVDVTGRYEFRTVVPGPVRGEAGWALVTVFARGLLHHLFTRAYFLGADEPAPSDPLLDQLPAERRATVLARQDGPSSYRFDIRLQGDEETVFLDYPAGRA